VDEQGGNVLGNLVLDIITIYENIDISRESRLSVMKYDVLAEPEMLLKERHMYIFTSISVTFMLK
jgi:hypothetical protein